MKIIKKIGVAILSICFIVLCIYNIFCNKDFFETSITAVISILVAIIVSYVLVQHKTDERRKKEKIDNLLYKIEKILQKEDFLVVKEGDLILQRSISNKICFLENYVENIDIKTDITRMKEYFDQYREFYGNHYKDNTYMEKSKNELMNYISRIDDICDSIHMKLL